MFSFLEACSIVQGVQKQFAGCGDVGQLHAPRVSAVAGFRHCLVQRCPDIPLEGIAVGDRLLSGFRHEAQAQVAALHVPAKGLCNLLQVQIRLVGILHALVFQPYLLLAHLFERCQRDGVAAQALYHVDRDVEGGLLVQVPDAKGVVVCVPGFGHQSDAAVGAVRVAEVICGSESEVQSVSPPVYGDYAFPVPPVCLCHSAVATEVE